MHKNIKNTLYYCLGIIFFAVVLQLVSSSIDKDLFFPSMPTIFKDFFKLLGNTNTYLCIINTIKHLIISLLLSIVLGSALGILASINDRIYLILKPVMTFFRILPIIIFIVILLLFLDYDNVPVATSVLILVPMFYEGTYQGIKNIDNALLDVYKLNSRLSLKVITRVYLPLISTNLKTVFINAIGMGIKVIVTTEYFSGINNTIGKAINDARVNLDYSHIYAYSFILIIVVILVEALPKILIYLYNLIKYKPLKN